MTVFIWKGVKNDHEKTLKKTKYHIYINDVYRFFLSVTLSSYLTLYWKTVLCNWSNNKTVCHKNLSQNVIKMFMKLNMMCVCVVLSTCAYPSTRPRNVQEKCARSKKNVSQMCMNVRMSQKSWFSRRAHILQYILSACV